MTSVACEHTMKVRPEPTLRIILQPAELFRFKYKASGIKPLCAPSPCHIATTRIYTFKAKKGMIMPVMLFLFLFMVSAGLLV